jgi:hypothetical protein
MGSLISPARYVRYCTTNLGENWYWGFVLNVVWLVSVQYEPVTYFKVTSTTLFFSLAQYKQ